MRVVQVLEVRVASRSGMPQGFRVGSAMIAWRVSAWCCHNYTITVWDIAHPVPPVCECCVWGAALANTSLAVVGVGASPLASASSVECPSYSAG